MKKIMVSVLAFFLVFASANVVEAKVTGGGQFQVVLPLGDMKDVTKTGIGLSGIILVPLEKVFWFVPRADLALVSYDSRQQMVYVGGYPTLASVRQEGFHLSVGPQFTGKLWSVWLYCSPQVGYSYFQTIASIPALAYYGYNASERQEHYDAFHVAADTGIMFDIGFGPLIDIGFKYRYLFDGVRTETKESVSYSSGSDLTVSLGVMWYLDIEY
ncbi:hypothetical protein KAH55_06855 [bacterium]|nr:hypothetical protein [bacterium]